MVYDYNQFSESAEASQAVSTDNNGLAAFGQALSSPDFNNDYQAATGSAAAADNSDESDEDGDEAPDNQDDGEEGDGVEDGDDDGEGGEQYLTSAAVDPDDQALDDVYAVILGLRDRGMFDGAAIGRFLHGYTGWQQNFQTYENRAAQLERLFQREFRGQGPIQIQINRPQFTDNSLTGNPTPFTFTVRFRGATQTFPISGH